MLGLALLASLALHALILLGLSVFRDSMPARIAPPPITAHLAKPKPPPEPPGVESPPQLAAPRPVARAPRPSPVPRAPATPVLSVEPAKQAVEPVPVVPPQPVAPAQTAARLESPAATGPDPGSVARFRLELMDLARRYKRYPRLAQDNNWEGRVELRIVFAENGAMTALTVKKSAGRAVLDEEAQAMIRSAQAQAAVPPALRGKAFTLEIPVEFSLQDAR